MKIVKKVSIVILVLIVALVVFYYAFPEKVAGLMLNAAASQAGLTKKEIQVDDHNIVYFEGGKGPTILLLHGYTGSKFNWIKFAPYLTKDYHIVIPDLPGYGESSKIEKDSYDLSNQILRLNKFVQAIQLNKFHIAGNSMGGLFAGTYAVRYPEKIISVGLFDSSGVKSPTKSTVFKMADEGINLFAINNSDDMQRLTSLLYAKPPSVPYPIEKVLLKAYISNRQIYEKEGNEIYPDFNSLEKDLPKIKAPTLILWGDQDKVIDISSVPVFEKGLKNHKTVIIKDCGHVPIIEKPQETATQYIDFVKGIK
jgi:pimeloyl-ACP methyl ester carboxylesterase